MKIGICISLLIVSGGVISADSEIKTDPLQACAIKALRGDFGKLKEWQLRGYKKAISVGAKVHGKAWVTSYYPSEGFRRGDITRSGVGVSEKSAACASKFRKKFMGKYVWTKAHGLRIVEDTGANSNESVAKRKGADIWLDYWWPHRKENVITDYSIF